MESLAILAALVLAYALVSQRVERLWLTPPMIEEGVDQPLIVTVMTVTVALSTVVHGLSARPLARSYGSCVRRHRQASEHREVPHLPSRRGS